MAVAKVSSPELGEQSPGTCALHSMYEKHQDEKWEEQGKKNEALFGMCGNLQKDVSAIKNRLAYGTGFLAAVYILSPWIWKILGVKP